MLLTYTEKTNQEFLIALPASKSISNRALIIQALCTERISLTNISLAEDSLIMQSLLRNKSLKKNVGISGTVARFLSAFLATQKTTYILDGHQRMQERPMKELLIALEELGAEINYLNKEHQIPVSINGSEIKGGRINISGKVSSQFISALMMIAPKLSGGLIIDITDSISSRPYIDMTAKVMAHFDGETKLKENSIRIPEQNYKANELIIENDWSSASYFYSALALMDEGSLVLNNLNFDSWQGDSVLAEIYYRLGIVSSRNGDDILLEKSDNVIDFLEYNFSDCPDLAQSVICTCVGLGIEGLFSGLHTLRHKETDRIIALQQELKKFNWDLNEQESGMFSLKPSNSLYQEDIIIETYNDHRMAMAFAPLAIVHGSLKIEDVSVVKKSFPDFWKEFAKLGIE